MTKLYDLRFSFFCFADIVLLCFMSFVLKKFVKKFPNKLIPIVDVVVSLLTTISYIRYKGIEVPLHFTIIMGIVDGLAAVGLHQVYKQTKAYFVLKKLMRTSINSKKKYRKISN